MQTVLFSGPSSASSSPNFVFLSKDGGPIQPAQEHAILAWNEAVEQSWTHHTFNVVLLRRHIVISLKAEDVTVESAVLPLSGRS